MWKKTKDENPKPKSPPLGKSPIEQLKEQAVIGPSISIKGELSGEEDLMIQGNLFGEEKIVIRESGVVRGNMRTPRFSLEDGAQFKGSIDTIPTMEKSSQH